MYDQQNAGRLASVQILPGGNGLPPLKINAFAPVDYIAHEAAKRDPAFVAEGDGVDPATQAAIDKLRAEGMDYLHKVLHPLDALEESVTGKLVAFKDNAIILLVLIVLGLAFTCLGAWKLIKD